MTKSIHTPWANIKSAFNTAAQALFGPPAKRPSPPSPTPPAKTAPPQEETVPTTRQYSREYAHYRVPTTPITPEKLAATPPHLNNTDGKALIWAYIGKDDPTRGDSRGANGLAQEVARLMGGRAVYVDQAMLNKNFEYTSGLKDGLAALIARDGSPDIVIGASSSDLKGIRTFKPTMVVNAINEAIDRSSRERTNLVPHDLTPDILAEAGRQFREHYPNLKGALYTVMLSSFHSHEAFKAMGRLARILGNDGDSTVFFCPNRRVHESRYSQLTQCFYNELLAQGVADRVHVIAPQFEEMRNGYNPYRGLIAESDHVIQIGDSHSMVAEAVCTGRPLYLVDEFLYYKELAGMGYVLDFMDTGERLTTVRLPPISITTEVAGKLLDEFDRFARLRTLGASEDAERRQRALERLVAAAAVEVPGRKFG